MRRVTLGLAMLLVLTVMPAAAMAQPGNQATEPDWYVDEDKLPFDALAGYEDAERLWGVYRDAGYRIEVPADWNGTLVMWAHGFRGTGLELTIDNHPLREYLIPNGYAWAASSYTANDYNVGDGVRSTNQLVRLFEEFFGEASTTYITGASMGGHVTVRSIEQPGQPYDGAMPICGVLGDYAEFDYFLDFNAAAQQIGLGYSNFPVDAALYVGTEVPQIKANLEAAPGSWPFGLNKAGEDFKQLVELRSGGDRPNYDEAFAFWNSVPSSATGPGNFLFDLGLGDGTVFGAPGVVVDNVGTVYQTDLDPALSPEEVALNAEIVRVAGSAALRANPRLLPIPNVSGDIDVPVLSLHNLGDLFVPFVHEVVYAQDVAAQGNSDLLVQRAIRGVAHCGFTATELVTAFVELDAWVQHGVKPAGDVVLDPAVVAAPDYGCRFTDFATEDGHVLATPCDEE